MLTKEEAEHRVARGAAHLDKVRPGWFRQIHIGTLALGSCADCIVGQLFRLDETEFASPFIVGLRALGWFDRPQDVLVGHFGEFRDGDIIRLAQDAWIAAIADRLAAAAVKNAPIPLDSVTA